MEFRGSDPLKKVPPCPVCGAAVECVYSRFGEDVYVCVECHTGITVPRRAWYVARVKNAQRRDNPDEKAG